MQDFTTTWPELIPFIFLFVLAGILVAAFVIFRERPSAEVVTLDRWRRWARRTAVIQVACFLVYPMFICGCHFHAEAIPAGLVPVVWGFYTYFCYRTRGEHWVGLVGGALSVFWLYFTWDSNISFAFTR